MLNVNFRYRIPKLVKPFREYVPEERSGLIPYDTVHLAAAILLCGILWKLVRSWVRKTRFDLPHKFKLILVSNRCSISVIFPSQDAPEPLR